jgi:uncharacterized UPF0160 family protein
MKNLVTHNGQFHADDVLAYTILNVIYPKNKLIRTRNVEIISKGNVVFDVGEKYEPENNLFDHHQVNCNEFFNEKFDIPMSSAGMVYKKFGKKLIKKIVEIEKDLINEVYQKFYETFILQFDAIDNGISTFINQTKFKYNLMNLPNIVSYSNFDNVYDEDEQHKRFLNCSKIYYEILLITLNNVFKKIKNEKND